MTNTYQYLLIHVDGSQKMTKIRDSPTHAIDVSR